MTDYRPPIRPTVRPIGQNTMPRAGGHRAPAKFVNTASREEGDDPTDDSPVRTNTVSSTASSPRPPIPRQLMGASGPSSRSNSPPKADTVSTGAPPRPQGAGGPAKKPPGRPPPKPGAGPDKRDEKPEELSPEDKLAKRREVRKKVAAEILSTEKTYVQRLRDLMELYVIPLGSFSKDKERAIVNEKEMQQLFSNVQLIYNFNQQFLQEVEQSVADWTDDSELGALFVRFAPFFKMYTTYVGNHGAASECLTYLMANKKAFREFSNKCATDPRGMVQGGNTKLDSLLIEPIQRIPRYQLLLKELIKQTDESNGEYGQLNQALAEVAKVGLHINEAVRLRENRMEVIRIQEEFSGKLELVQPNRRFVKQGPLTKKCRADDRKYEFFLFNNLLLYATKGVSKYKLHRSIEINNGFVIQDLPDKADDKAMNRFQIVNSNKSFIVYAEDQKTKAEWLMDLFKCIEENRKAIANGEVKSVFVQPVWQGNNSSKNCMVCDANFTWMKRRHHCRYCGSLVCNECSKKRMMIKNKEKAEQQRVCDKCVKQIITRQTGGTPNATPTATEVSSEIPVSPRGRDRGGAKAAGDPGDAIEAPEHADKKDGDESGSDDEGEEDQDVDESTAKAAATKMMANIEKDKQALEKAAAASSSASSNRDKVRAKYPYMAAEPKDLTFAEGDIITIVKKDVSGWWTGTIKGKTGLFPANYVQELTEDGSAAGDSSEVDLRVVATMEYAAMHDVELPLKKGDKVHVTNKDGTGWYYGYLVMDVDRAGWFDSKAVKEDKTWNASLGDYVEEKKAPPPSKAKTAPTAMTAVGQSTRDLNSEKPKAVAVPPSQPKLPTIHQPIKKPVAIPQPEPETVPVAPDFGSDSSSSYNSNGNGYNNGYDEPVQQPEPVVEKPKPVIPTFKPPQPKPTTTTTNTNANGTSSTGPAKTFAAPKKATPPASSYSNNNNDSDNGDDTSSVSSGYSKQPAPPAERKPQPPKPKAESAPTSESPNGVVKVRPPIPKTLPGASKPVTITSPTNGNHDKDHTSSPGNSLRAPPGPRQGLAIDTGSSPFASYSDRDRDFDNHSHSNSVSSVGSAHSNHSNHSSNAASRAVSPGARPPQPTFNNNPTNLANPPSSGAKKFVPPSSSSVKSPTNGNGNSGFGSERPSPAQSPVAHSSGNGTSSSSAPVKRAAPPGPRPVGATPAAAPNGYHSNGNSSHSNHDHDSHSSGNGQNGHSSASPSPVPTPSNNGNTAGGNAPRGNRHMGPPGKTQAKTDSRPTMSGAVSPRQPGGRSSTSSNTSTKSNGSDRW